MYYIVDRLNKQIKKMSWESLKRILNHEEAKNDYYHSIKTYENMVKEFNSRKDIFKKSPVMNFETRYTDVSPFIFYSPLIECYCVYHEKIQDAIIEAYDLYEY
jgi:hypothetical protein